jgi:uncharacterized membrane protein YgdD (TMEM256/DUF423 family)
MERTFFIAGAAFAMLAVAAGAFGAHALGPRLSVAHLATYETAVRYQMYHALALFVIAWAVTYWPGATLLQWSGRLFIAGIIIFSSTLYIIALGGPRWLGAITPLGGLCFLAGWLLAIIAVLRHR